MPSTTLDQVQKTEEKLQQAIAALGDAPDAAEKRALGKKLRRVQRKRRAMAVEAERKAKTAPKAKAAAAPAEAPAEEAPAEAPAEESAE